MEVLQQRRSARVGRMEVVATGRSCGKRVARRGGGNGEGTCRDEAEVVVVPRWWTGNQPPKYIIFLKTIAKWVFGKKNGQEVSGSKPLPSLRTSGEFF